ncbi:3-keto-5-aminohexanoate cleavage protein [Leifsonia sp. ZF2019]|uniref:3-keto-5-aminohexanoate cleavage protein n=1 Tax=Leifsonia sp. ZF2019 TaxID=2781978 RepID=UPI001CBF0762|nr:3-keto-5-aminohexanoate cleavage protein [Leifsonia sp. ZF2019]UAJ80269.1 3-keto-5-aminohexanoate cleavage protein [Leifsonia sp. ZF2019]
MLLKAAINGGRTPDEFPGVPLTAADIAQQAAEALAAGATVVHAHARAADGAQTIAPEHVGAMVRAFRAAAPGAEIGTTTGLWTCSGHDERMRLVAAWPADALPDFASVAFSEDGAAEAAQLVLERGMVLESAVWSMDDVPALLASPTLHRNVRILIEPDVESASEAVDLCRRIAAVLRDAGVTAPLLYHGYDGSVWPVVRAAIEDGCETRIGLEDGLTREDGSLAEGNAELVRLVRVLEAVPAR